MPRNETPEPQPTAIVWLERGIVGCLFIIVLCAPHSIAGTQIGWGVGMLLWLIRSFIYPRPKFVRSPIDYALLGFFIISGLSCVFSYEPLVSIGKMRAASLFTIVYLFSQNVRSLKLAKILAFTLVGSCMLNVLLTAEQLTFGKGVKLEGIKAESPLTKAVFRNRLNTRPSPIVSGDIVWAVDGVRVSTPEEIASALAAGPPIAQVSIYHVEWTPALEVPRGHLLAGTSALEQLGATGWSRGRDWRATGFYGHWVTYAEAIQLIASLALGLFLGLAKKFNRTGLLLAVAVVGLIFSLGMSVTRASWAGFAVSAALMLLLSVSRRTLLIVGLCAIPLALAAILVLQQKRSVGFFDQKDQSTTWREQVWHEGYHLLISQPRHLLVGVGMDSIKAKWRQWGLFDNGKLPMGHMHSNLLQIALERGVPALIVWLILIGMYARMLFHLIRAPRIDFGDSQTGVVPRGVALGGLGGLAGFVTSGLVHYNWGDSEVVMILYLIMGLNVAVWGMVKRGMSS